MCMLHIQGVIFPYFALHLKTLSPPWTGCSMSAKSHKTMELKPMTLSVICMASGLVHILIFVDAQAVMHNVH